ncbi:CD276 antigen-like [Echeneis naucrates]|uniref:CD276 antigen-like n=1 Tax=Echeneis naucrates TaxID=173247 RepID=A0A665UTQ3_ECHNA|nr:CD276 antigen-like [Echeneis naucrates]
MTLVKVSLVWGTLNLLWSFSRGAPLVCVITKSCILPCSFSSGSDPVLHWIHMTAGDRPVHSFYHNQDQLAYQNQNYRGRTSLFKDQISRGNASLQLREVKVQDEGRYRCYTSTMRGNQEAFVELRVIAPVDEVDLHQVKNTLTCSSGGIYPEPELTWSTSPPSDVAPKDKVSVQQTDQLLYKISSSLILANNTDLNYICTISTPSGSRKATMLKQNSMDVTGNEVTILCVDSNTLKRLTWRFNQDQVILTRTRTEVSVSEEWRQLVKDESKSGSLTLKDFSYDHDGIYSCEWIDAEETLITNIFLRKQGDPEKIKERNIIGAVVGVLVVVLVVLTSVFLYFKISKVKKSNRKNKPEESAGKLNSSEETPQAAESSRDETTQHFNIKDEKEMDYEEE